MQPQQSAVPRPPLGETELSIMALAQEGGLLEGAELYDHQYENVERFVKEHRHGSKQRGAPYGIIVADAPGLGKTLSALKMACLARALSGQPWVLIAAPVAVLRHWTKQAALWAPGLEVQNWQTMSRAQRGRLRFLRRARRVPGHLPRCAGHRCLGGHRP